MMRGRNVVVLTDAELEEHTERMERARRGREPVTRAEMLNILANLGSSTDIYGKMRRHWDL
jgi:hypothetical protein